MAVHNYDCDPKAVRPLALPDARPLTRHAHIQYSPVKNPISSSRMIKWEAFFDATPSLGATRSLIDV